MSKAVKKAKTAAKVNVAAVSPKKTLVVGKHIDDNGKRLRPGMAILFWVSDSASSNGISPAPAMLTKKSPTTGEWSVSYMQYDRWSFASVSDFSPTAKIHCWTFMEAYDEWETSQSYPLEK